MSEQNREFRSRQSRKSRRQPLIPVSLVPVLLGMTGQIYLVGALVPGRCFLYFWLFVVTGRQLASLANDSARISVPWPIASGLEYSSGLWLTPPRQGMNSIDVGQICEMNDES